MVNSRLLALLDPAVYPGPVGPLGRGEEEGPTAADSGLRSSHGSIMFWDRDRISSGGAHSLSPDPALRDPCAFLLAGSLPCLPVRPQSVASLNTLNSIRSLFLHSLSLWLFIHGEESPLREQPPKAPPLEAGHLGCPRHKNQTSGLVSPRPWMCTHDSDGQQTGRVSIWDSFFLHHFKKN